MSETYYKATVPKLIKKYKLMVDQCLDIVGQKIAADLSEDKMHNVTKAKKMAAETAKWGAQEIDDLTAEMEGRNLKEGDNKKAINYSEKMAN